MRINLFFLCFVFLLSSCSSSDKKKSNTQGASLNDFENLPFQGLQTIRVMLSFISNQVDQENCREFILKELKKIGNVRTPSDTSIDELSKAQDKPFAIVTLDIIELESSKYARKLPVLCISIRMYEEAKLALNQKDFVSNVWERIKYVDIYTDKSKTFLEVSEAIKTLLNEFSEKYQSANSKKIEPVFYIGKNI